MPWINTLKWQKFKNQYTKDVLPTQLYSAYVVLCTCIFLSTGLQDDKVEDTMRYPDNGCLQIINNTVHLIMKLNYFLFTGV